MAKVHLDRSADYKPGRRDTICGRKGFYAPVEEAGKGDVWVTDDKAKVTCIQCRRLLMSKAGILYPRLFQKGVDHE